MDHYLPPLRDGQLMQPFADKGRTSSLLDQMPVHIIVNSSAPLLGAACH